MIKMCIFRVEYFYLLYFIFICFILFVIFCSYFFKGFDLHVSLFCFFSISGIAPLITCYDLQFTNTFKKFIKLFYVFQLLCFSNITANICLVQFPISNT